MIIDTSQSKPPLKLFVQTGEGFKEQLEAHACGECKNVAASEQAARECHGIRRCDCGEAIKENYYTACAACRSTEEQKRDADRIANAKRVSEVNTSALYCECCERFFYDGSEELIETHRDEGRAIPEIAWACDEQALKLDAEEILQGSIDSQEFNEETQFSAAQVLELHVLLQEWLSRNRVTNHFTTGEVVEVKPAPEPTACPNCGHFEYHCPASGCNYSDAAHAWCECETREPAAGGSA